MHRFRSGFWHFLGVLLTVALALEEASAANYRGGSQISAPSCVPNPCQNGGLCVNDSSSAVCYCPPEWTGAACGDPSNEDDDCPRIAGGEVAIVVVVTFVALAVGFAMGWVYKNNQVASAASTAASAGAAMSGSRLDSPRGSDKSTDSARTFSGGGAPAARRPLHVQSDAPGATVVTTSAAYALLEDK